MRKKVLSCIFCFSLAVFAGCNSADSGDYATHEIRCEFNVYIWDAKSDTQYYAEAVFWVEGRGINALSPINLILTDNDIVTVNGADMRRTRDYYDYYSVMLQSAEQYTFTFQRGDGSSYDATVKNVPPIAITSPQAGASISRAEDLNITWTNPVENQLVGIGLWGDEYLNRISEDIADLGAYTIPAGTLQLDKDAPSSSVEAILAVSRSARGIMASELSGSIYTSARNYTPFISKE